MIPPSQFLNSFINRSKNSKKTPVFPKYPPIPPHTHTSHPPMCAASPFFFPCLLPSLPWPPILSLLLSSAAPLCSLPSVLSLLPPPFLLFSSSSLPVLFSFLPTLSLPPPYPSVCLPSIPLLFLSSPSSPSSLG